MKRTHLLLFLLCTFVLSIALSCVKTNPDVYDNSLIINGQEYRPIVSSVIGENSESVTIDLYEPYDNLFKGTLVISKSSLNKTLDISNNNDCIKLTYTQKGSEQAELNLVSGTMKVEHTNRYGIRVDAIDNNGGKFFILIVTGSVTFHDDEGRWY